MKKGFSFSRMLVDRQRIMQFEGPYFTKNSEVSLRSINQSVLCVGESTDDIFILSLCFSFDSFLINLEKIISSMEINGILKYS